MTKALTRIGLGLFVGVLVGSAVTAPGARQEILAARAAEAEGETAVAGGSARDSSRVRGEEGLPGSGTEGESTPRPPAEDENDAGKKGKEAEELEEERGVGSEAGTSDDPGGSAFGVGTGAESGTRGAGRLGGQRPPGPGAASAGEEKEGRSAAARLAQIFATMEPEEAAAVLQHLDDPSVQVILFHMSDRIAGQILASLEPERAARLSRAVFGSRGG